MRYFAVSGMEVYSIGILVGATTIVSSGLKPFNMALAQLRVPFLPQQPQTQVPVQQPITAAGQNGGGGQNCVGCITTQNLADGAVTNPKLGPLSVSTANIGQGQVTIGNIAPGAVTTQNIAPGAVSITVQTVKSSGTAPPAQVGEASAVCPSGSVVTGGGFIQTALVNTGQEPQITFSGPGSSSAPGGSSQWSVDVFNHDATQPLLFTALAQCTAVQP